MMHLYLDKYPPMPMLMPVPMLLLEDLELSGRYAAGYAYGATGYYSTQANKSTDSESRSAYFTFCPTSLRH